MNLEMEVITPTPKLRAEMEAFKRDFVTPDRWDKFDFLVTSAMAEAATKAVAGCDRVLAEGPSPISGSQLADLRKFAKDISGRRSTFRLIDGGKGPEDAA